MPARCPWIRLVALVVLGTCACFATAPDAYADLLDDAETHLAEGATERARATLGAWFDETEDAGAEELLRAAQLARTLPDLALLQSAKAAAESLEAEGDAGRTLDLALGFAYLGLAEENLRLRTTSRSISLYFADALARAEAVPMDSPHAETAARLGAGVRFAQGDLPGAVAALDAYRAAKPSVSARFDALHGRLTYERAAGMPAAASGHATPQAQALLKQAATWLGSAMASEDLTGAQRRAAALRQAYAFHRLGDVEAGTAAYARAYDAEPRQAALVVRGLQSLHARDGDALLASLEALAKQHGDAPAIVDAILAAHQRAGAKAQALVLAERRIAAAPEDPMSWYWLGRTSLEAGVPSARALDHFAQGLRVDPGHLYCSFQIEQLARASLEKDPMATVAIYERLIALRPDDPYTRNNFGFVLRDLVSRHTEKLEGGLERIPADAPEGTHDLLERCVEVYAEAVANIDPAKDAELDERTAWNLAGIVNDYGLIIHYFVDVQDARLAERQYLRALEMTDYGFKDTYLPNLHRLYRYVLTGVDDLWRWYRVAREAQYAILAEAADENGNLVLVPDERKRAVARRDVEVLRARILQVMGMDAKEDGLPWPPAKENGNDR